MPNLIVKDLKIAEEKNARIGQKIYIFVNRVLITPRFYSSVTARCR
jgi:hypothetical protein